MSFLNRLLRRHKNLPEIDGEIEAHLAERMDELIESGLSPGEARYRALRDFGNVTLLKEDSRSEWSSSFLERRSADTRYALRSLWRNPGFALTVVFTLALGIGANAAVFNLLHAVILRSLPVPDPEQLRLLSVVRDKEFDDNPIFSAPVLSEMQQAVATEASIAGFTRLMGTRVVVVGRGKAERVEVQLVTGNFFQTLGVQPRVGRLLNGGDGRESGNFPAVLSYGYWAKHFAGDPAAVGRSVILNGIPVTIAGVTASKFFGIEPGRLPDLWLPASAQHDIQYQENYWNSNGNAARSFLNQPEIRWLEGVVRIFDPRIEPRVLAALNTVHRRDMQREAHNWDDPVSARIMLQSRVRLEAGDKGLGNLRQNFGSPLIVLMSAAVMVLLIACVNLASLALARITSRRKEIAVRCSIGASRGRIVSQFLTETFLLSVLGGFAAIPIALTASRLLLRWASEGNPMPLEVGLSPTLLLFVAVSSVIIGMALGLLPIQEALKVPLADALKAQAGSLKGMRLPWGRTLIAAQVAFSFVLLTGAILFVRTLVNYLQVPLGFTPRQIVTVRLDLRAARYNTNQLQPIYDRVTEKVRQIPGVEAAAFATCGLAEGCKGISGVRIAGRSEMPREHSVQENIVGPDYFRTVGMHLLAGRTFDRHDTANKQALAVINSATAVQYFRGQSAIGQHFGYGKDDRHYEIIGVVSDARVNDVHEAPSPMAYYSLPQNPAYVSSLEIRTRADLGTIEAPIREAIRAADPNLPVIQVAKLTERLDGNLLRERLLAKLASGLAFLALALACLGVYGVLSYAITRRTSEIGIRLALGAERSSVSWMVLRESLFVLVIGLAVGVPVAVLTTRLIDGLFYGVSAGDPMSMSLGAASMVAIGLFATLVPAWRASRVDPNVALRYE